MSNASDGSALDAVILCGGLGTRLQSVLKDKPKPMVDINDRPFLELLIDYVGKFGFRRFILCAGHKGDFIRKYFEEKKNGKTYIISQETIALGTAGAIKHAASLITSEVFLAMNGDSFCPVDLKSFLDFHFSKKALASIALAPMEDTQDYGGVALGEDGAITRFDEKTDAPATGWVNAGIYIFNKQILDNIPDGKKVSLEQEIFPSLAGKGLFGFPTQNRLLDIGTPERLEIARNLLTDVN